LNLLSRSKLLSCPDKASRGIFPAEDKYLGGSSVQED